MFCDEVITKVYMGIADDPAIPAPEMFLDCFYEMAYHCTEGYRIVLETDHYAISLSSIGVTKESKQNLRERDNEWLRPGLEYMEEFENEPPWVDFETTLFVGERVRSVEDTENGFLVKFDDFELKIIPHKYAEEILAPRPKYHFSYRHVLGCDRHLKAKCPHCGGEGTILLDFVEDYIVRCRECKRSTWAGMNLIDAIEDWNSGTVPCDTTHIVIE